MAEISVSGTDSFGFLPIRRSFSAGPYVIEPAEDHDAVVSALRESGDDNSGLYSPMAETLTSVDGEKTWVRKPRSRHVAKVFRVSATHTLRRSDGAPLPDRTSFRKGEGGFIVAALGFLFGVRCQFYDWWFDGAIPVRTSPVCTLGPTDDSKLLDSFLAYYARVTEKERLRIRNLMHLKGRIKQYQWEWERFFFEYTVFDALYRSCRDAGLVGEAAGHAKRFEALGSKNLIHWCQRCQVYAQRIVPFRNDLAHEAIWQAGALGRDGDEHLATFLSLLNNSLVLALAQVPCGFSRACWTTLSPSAVDWEDVKP